MLTLYRAHLQTLVLFFLFHLSKPVCVEVPSDTEAVLGDFMRLTCISCMPREEVKAKTSVDWYFTPKSENNSTNDKLHIFRFENEKPSVVDEHFSNRLVWNGSHDMQDVSIRIQNVTDSDRGFYQCLIHRTFEFGFFTPTFSTEKNFTLDVKKKASTDAAAIYSQIMMYVLLVFLTFWLLVEMVYCYRKISKSDEQAQDTATNYLAIPSEQKDNPAAPVTE
ncbi:sodium channel regulatory subunit beta-3 isoform X1 [Nothobranchius furzeri]|uniref:Sodium channel regulatory subunit beta-3 n=2 Tax=Nothobranchius TaxID=28779 RepID=A0A1A8VC05_NOTFU|nr:sodium channel subunit beta-3 isoform X1 [Nothobranchius furzeri]XP_015807020.1 sodium channel subunit beta-3 isoform X1 [Nothobranchius furzeri]XP_015807021.1 sodium channel subunit beta-3 isoform X1 [Nothobranchius furzeri]XP_015807022.1 sodium channel subunit beta-3 isoform X1 [Nothobranchius furzeri]XP_015807023.1 sodium channel subunit beta-3 isoform X1 [Nothobranchius furzeri]XP_054598663.1 sodium channel subunit beta-3 isoform X1 [Nothobranchius furzeri]KAF7218937.1 transcript varia